MTENQHSYFENHASVETLFFTSDGFAFFKEADAFNHAKHLDDDEITTISRSETDELDEDEDDLF
jgi:hypothetical protein